jgi:hypothetical protein
MKHPSEIDLSLFAGRDLSLLEDWRVGRHVRYCDSCAGVVRSFRAAGEELRGSLQDLPEGLNWDRLASEMTGNIHVGLAAGECVAPVIARSQRLNGWRTAAVMASVTVLLMGGWWLNIPPRQSIAKAPVVLLENTSNGIELRQDGSSLTLMHSRGGKSVVLASSPGSFQARYVDEETGQVTINKVYAQ